jgi:hypothetical protein
MAPQTKETCNMYFKYNLPTTNQKDILIVVETGRAVYIEDRSGEVVGIKKDDLPKLIEKLAEIADRHISRKAA